MHWTSLGAGGGWLIGKQPDGSVGEQNGGSGAGYVTQYWPAGIAGPAGQPFWSVEPVGHVPASPAATHVGHVVVDGWMQ